MPDADADRAEAERIMADHDVSLEVALAYIDLVESEARDRDADGDEP